MKQYLSSCRFAAPGNNKGQVRVDSLQSQRAYLEGLMRLLSLLMILTLVTMLSACRGSVENDASSELFVYNDLTGGLLANGNQTHGTLTMNVGDTRQLRIMRRVTDAEEGTITTNVTATADYNSSQTLVATVSQNGTADPGVVTALSVGTATIEIIFRDEGGDISNDDHAFIDVNVIP
jgi:hypothetical protein